MAEMSGQGNDVEQQLLSSNPIIEVGAPTIHAAICASSPAAILHAASNAWISSGAALMVHCIGCFRNCVYLCATLMTGIWKRQDRSQQQFQSLRQGQPLLQPRNSQ